MSDRARRIGENEVLYREVNERVRDLNEEFGLTRDPVDFVCECGRLECAERVGLTIAEYEHVREEPTTFAVLPGHQLPDVESVVEEHDGYLVVRKHDGEPADLASRNA